MTMTPSSESKRVLNSTVDSVLSTTNKLPSEQRIAFIKAGWHSEIVEQSEISFTKTLCENEIERSSIDIFEVPGSLEIPLQCKLLAQSGDYAVIVAAGLIVDGGIYRHDFVASSVLDAMMKVQLDTLVPILSLVLTPHYFSADDAHQSFFFDHFKHKGEEAGRACLMTLKNLSGLKLSA